MLRRFMLVASCSAVAFSAHSSASASANSTERQANEAGRKVVCTQGFKELLRFSAPSGHAEYSDESFSLSVHTQAEVLENLTLTNRNTGDIFEATRGDGFLQAKLITNEAPQSPISESTIASIHGIYSLYFAAPSGDEATVSAYGRRGTQQTITLSLQTNEAPANPLEITCRLEN